MKYLTELERAVISTIIRHPELISGIQLPINAISPDFVNVLEVEERSSFDVSSAVADVPAADGKREVSVVFRVYDWYGAGGLFRPIFLSTTPISASAEMIR